MLEEIYNEIHGEIKRFNMAAQIRPNRRKQRQTPLLLGEQRFNKFGMSLNQKSLHEFYYFWLNSGSPFIFGYQSLLNWPPQSKCLEPLATMDCWLMNL